MNRGISVVEDNGLFQISFRKIQPVQLVISPTQTIQICPIRWIALDRLLGHGESLIQLDATVREHETEIIQDCRIVFIKLQGFTKSLLRFVYLVLLFIQCSLKEIDLLFLR